MTLTKYSSKYFTFLNRWITDANLLFQFAGTEFSYPLNEKQIENYQHKNSERCFYIGLNGANEAVAFGEIIPQENQIPRIGRLLIGNPAERGKGYGTVFIHLLLAQCKEQFQTNVVELFVLEDNHSAIKCYHKIGFQFLHRQTWEMSHNGQKFLLLKMAYNF